MSELASKRQHFSVYILAAAFYPMNLINKIYDDDIKMGESTFPSEIVLRALSPSLGNAFSVLKTPIKYYVFLCT